VPLQFKDILWYAGLPLPIALPIIALFSWPFGICLSQPVRKKSRVEYHFSGKESCIQALPNTACTWRWGVGAFLGLFLCLSFFRLDGVPPPAPAQVTQAVSPFFAKGWRENDFQSNPRLSYPSIPVRAVC
jgi:hypothetical protein